jgi:hypothetical protein
VSTYDWTNIGTEVLPVQHRAQFLAHLRGEHTGLTGMPEPIWWVEPRGSFPQETALAIRAAVEQFEISPVLHLAHNLTWQCDQNTRKPGPGPDSEVLGIIGVQTDTEAMYFVHRGIVVTPVLIETLPADD